MAAARPRRVTLLLLVLAVLGVGTYWIARSATLALRERMRASPEFVDAIERLDLELDLRAPPRLRGSARLTLRPGAQGPLPFVLNRSLEIERVRDDAGHELEWRDLGPLRSDFFKEARGVEVTLLATSRAVHVEYHGRGLDGSEGSDWRGALMLAPDELRMSEQAAFSPQVPESLDGPAIRLWPSRIRVLAPESFEAYAPGSPCAVDTATAGARAWCFESESPTSLSVFAAPRVRTEVQLDRATVVLLLTPEHAALGPAMAAEVDRMLRFYAERWGTVGTQRLGIVETLARGNSVNWFAMGMVAIERGALRRNVPVDTLAHEVAHLWWGQTVQPHGRGERFLTESLAEYGAWRYQETHGAPGEASALARAAESEWWSSVHDTGVDPALADVRFATKGYSTLAYSKGPAALWRLHEQAGAPAMDALLRDFRERVGSEDAPADSFDAFCAAVRAHSGLAEPELALELFAGADHTHATLSNVRFEGGLVRGGVVSERCPAGIEAPRPSRARLVARTAGGAVAEAIELPHDDDVSFELRAADDVLALRLEPLGMRSRTRAISVVRADVGCVSSEPQDGAKGVALGVVRFRLRFGHALQPLPQAWHEAIESACRANRDPLEIHAATLESDGRELVVELEGTLPETDHELVVPEGLVTQTGIELAEVRVRFRTQGAGALPRPRLSTTSPAAGSIDVPVDLGEIRLVFSEPMRHQNAFRNSDLDQLARRGFARLPLFDVRWIDDRTFVLRLESALEPGRRYALPIDGSFTSRLGLRHERVDLTFQTRP